MFCTKCGAKLDDGAKFCTSCGAKMDEVENQTEETKNEETSKAEDVKEEKEEDSKTEEEASKEEVKESKEEAKEESKEEAKEDTSDSKNDELKTDVPKMEEPAKEIEKNPETKEEDEKKEFSAFDKPKKGNAKILIGVGVVVVAAVVALILYLTVFKTTIGYNKFKKALDDNKYKDAKKIAKEYKLDDSKKADAALELIENEIDEIKTQYKEEDLDDDEVVEKLEDLGKIKLDDVEDKVDEALKWVEEQKNAKRVYENAQSSYDNKNYEYALTLLEEIKDDAVNYSDVKKLREKCNDGIVEDAITNADYYIENNNYDYALETLNKAKEKVGDDNEILNDALKGFEDKVVDKAISYAQEQTYTYYKVNSLKKVYDQFPDNEKAKEKYEEFSKQYANEIFTDSLETKFENSWYSASDISSSFKDYCDDYADNSFYVDELTRLYNEKIASYKTAVEDAAKIGVMYDVKSALEYYVGLVGEDDEDAKALQETYGEYIEGSTLYDNGYDEIEGNAYNTSYYSAPDGGKDFDYVDELSVSSYSDKDGSIEFAPGKYKAISGYVTRTDKDTNGKVIILADKKIIYSCEIKETKDNAFNIEIPAKTKKITIKFLKGKKYNNYYLGNVFLTTKYYATEASDDTEETKDEADKDADVKEEKEDDSDKDADVKEEKEDKSDKDADVKEEKEDESDKDADVKEEKEDESNKDDAKAEKEDAKKEK